MGNVYIPCIQALGAPAHAAYKPNTITVKGVLGALATPDYGATSHVPVRVSLPEPPGGQTPATGRRGYVHVYTRECTSGDLLAKDVSS